MNRPFCISMTCWCLLQLVATEVKSQEPSTRPSKPNAPAAQSSARPNPLLASIEDKPGLPRVLLIGDSISIGYTLAVRDQLKDVANVHRIPTNGGPTTNGIKNLKKWLGDKKWDVIHFNWGLHDLKYIQDDASKLADPKAPGSHHQVSLSEYEKNLRELVSQLKDSGAQLIWCSTTPVPEGAAGRVPGDEIKFNEVAFRVMKDTGVRINDLYGHAMSKSNIQMPANVHYDAAGSEFLATKVSSEIKACLSK
ncbi:MAG: SGNH/GDSL hydrolase family protein [Pirellula sp.]